MTANIVFLVFSPALTRVAPAGFLAVDRVFWPQAHAPGRTKIAAKTPRLVAFL
jgi:hypothetical protein